MSRNGAKEEEKWRMGTVWAGKDKGSVTVSEHCRT